MAGSVKSCLFCKKVGNSSREHVLRQRMGDLLGLRKGPHAQLRRWVDGDGPQEYARAAQNSMYDWRIKSVCKPCNEGWMDQLDRAVEATVLDLAEGLTTQITAEQVESITAWAAKTVAVLASGERGEFLISRAELDFIYQNHTAPTTWQVWVARAALPEDRQVITRHTRGILHDDVLGNEPVHATAIAQKQLAVFVRGTAGIRTGECNVTASTSAIHDFDARFVQLTHRSTPSVSLANRQTLTRDQVLKAVERIIPG
ncbi:hypothetical protein ACFYU5_08545 [Nocardia aobensis]|uniref:Uncharacterized protein n=1 Tax=Nocardia aobensis TaxID=257277 RepID=A0ABW6NZ34_9NOCA